MSELTALEMIEIENDAPLIFGCNCPACMAMDKNAATDASGPGGVGNPTDSSTPGLFEMLTITQAADGTWFFSGDRDIDSALIGSRWTVTEITYSFPTSGAQYGENYDTGQANFHLEFGEMQKAAARASFAMVEGYTNLTFTEVDEDDGPAILRLSQTASAGTASASGYFPGPDYRSGDIWFGRTSQPYYDTPEKGNWGFATIMHEIGHTLGLKHGHQDYTFQDLSIYFGGGAPRPGSRSTPPEHDGQAWTLMSYRSDPGLIGPTVFAGEAFNQPQSYMQNDIAALQYLYGANYTTNATDSTYTWSETTGEMFINGVGQGTATSNVIFQTIWDGNGVDTYDVSNYDDGVAVDLRAGAFSTFSVDQLANHRAYSSQVALAPGNIANALLHQGNTASLIENAKGGDGSDWLTGNQVSNVLTGGEGDDVLEGREGNDTLDGGAGSDTAVFFDNTGGVTVTLNDGAADIVVANDGFIDTLKSIENVIGGEGDDALTGDNADNLLDGGKLGADTLTGGDGDDTLIASGYVRTASDLPDITKPQAQDNGSMVNALALTAADFDTAEDEFITSSTTLPHATVNAVATGGSLEYYRLDVQAGDQAIFDIDTFATQDVDTWIELVNAGGTVIANNDTGASGDLGGFGNDDAYLVHTFATAGTYYLRVGQWTTGAGAALPLTAGQEYTLNISWTGGDQSTYTLDETGSGALTGGSGDDLLVAGAGDDVVDGGADDDTLSYQAMFAGVTVSLGSQGAAQSTVNAGSDTISNVENLIGSGFADTLTGDGGANRIEGGAGDDAMDGAGGVDTVTYEHAAAGVIASLLAGTASGGAGGDTIANFEHVIGSAFNDTLTGNADQNRVEGGDGDDVLAGGGVSAGVDTLVGGNGVDVASFAAYSQDITADLSGADDDLTGQPLAVLQGIEGLIGGTGDDNLIGNGQANKLTGGEGADVLLGRGGSDTLEGGLGDDRFTGGAGVDTAVMGGSVGVTVDLTVVGNQNTGQGTDRFSGIENVIGSTGNDILTGNGQDNVFTDTGGNDSYTGNGGVDTVDYSAATAAVNLGLSVAGAQTAGGGAGSDTLAGIENLTGSAFNDTFTGQNGAGTVATTNRLLGGLGNDLIQGGTAGDFIEGGDGADLIAGDMLNGLSTTDGATGADGNDTIWGGIGHDVVIGGQGNDWIDAGDGNDTIVQGVGNGTRSATAATLTAISNVAGGFDTINGGEGTDTVYLFYTGLAGGVTLDISEPLQTNYITLDGAAAGELIDVERVIVRGATGGDSMTGGISADAFYGQEGNDTLNGGIGNDSLFGGLGDDNLVGGHGLDYANYSLSATGVTVNLTTGVATGEGSDTLSGIEYLVGSAFSDHLTGDDGFNIINDNGATAGTGLGGSDTYLGMGGNDTLTVFRAAGNASSAIVLDGGSGHDTLSFTSTARTVGTPQTDTATLNGGSGNDTISMTGTGIASSVIDGGHGNDTITVGLGGAAGLANHTVTGGSGSDVFTLSNSGAVSAYNTARNGSITDFQAKAGGDRFEFTSYLNAAGGLTGYAANANAFTSGHLRLVQSGVDLLLQVDRDAGAGANSFVTLFTLEDGASKGFTAFNFDGMQVNNLTLTGTDFADILAGSDGADTITGGLERDWMDGGLGDDSLNGGGASDTVSYEFATAAVNVDVSIAGAQNTGWGSDILVDVEHLIGSAFNDTLSGGAGFNSLEGGLGDDLLSGGAGQDRLMGGDGADTVMGGADNDRLDGGAGSDTVSYAGLATAVTVHLGAGSATGDGADLIQRMENVIGGDGADSITGSNGLNRLEGGLQNDSLIGLNGADTLLGGDGDDVLTGGRHVDVLTGGLGVDRFVFDDSDNAIDRIVDLENTDVIDLSNIDANGNQPGSPGFTLVSSFTNTRGEVMLSYDSDTDTTRVWMDTNGDGAADRTIHLTGDHDDFTNFDGLVV